MNKIYFFLAFLFLSYSQFTTAQPRKPRPRFNATHPDVHDPVLAIGQDGRYYLFSTGWGIQAMSSADMKTWRLEESPLQEIPEWTKEAVPGFKGHIWAPDISYHKGLWYLYYSCSTFGKNESAIGLAVSKSLNTQDSLYGWVDKGLVVASHRRQDMYNAIDPNLILDRKGRPWLSFGSFWDGVQIMRLKKHNLAKPKSHPKTIARRVGRKLSQSELNDKTKFTVENGDTIEAGENAIEAPFIFYRDGWYYLFVSMDYCCRGEKSTYNTVYGRSRKVKGPYIDKNGNEMLKGGGSYLFGPNEFYFGVGHCSVYDVNGQILFISHAYEKEESGRAKLFIHPLEFDSEGWIKVSE